MFYDINLITCLFIVRCLLFIVAEVLRRREIYLMQANTYMGGSNKYYVHIQHIYRYVEDINGHVLPAFFFI